MPITPFQFVRWVSLIGLHTVAAGMLLYLIGAAGGGAQPLRWPWLAAALILALLADYGLERAPAAWRGPLWTGAGLAAAALLLKGLLGGGLNPLAGWSVFGRDSFIEATLSGAALIWLWRRGPRIDTMTNTQITGFFRTALVMLGVLLVLVQLAGGAALDGPDQLTVLTSYIIALIFAALLALSAGNISAGSHNASGGRWVVSALLPVVVVTLSGLLLAALFSAGARLALFQAIDALRGAVAWVFQPVLFLGQFLVIVLARLFPVVDPGLPPVPVEPEADLARWTLSRLREVEAQAPPDAPPAWLMVLIGVVMLAALGVALFFLVRLVFSRSFRPRLRSGDEERSSLWEWGSIGGDLRGMLGALFEPLRRQRGGLRAALAGLTGGDPASRIRRAYIRLLLLAEEREQGRPPSQTPREYRPRAERLAPAARADIIILTDAYEAARYGPPPSPDEAAAAEAAIQAISAERAP